MGRILAALLVVWLIIGGVVAWLSADDGLEPVEQAANTERTRRDAAREDDEFRRRGADEDAPTWGDLD